MRFFAVLIACLFLMAAVLLLGLLAVGLIASMLIGEVATGVGIGFVAVIWGLVVAWLNEKVCQFIRESK